MLETAFTAGVSGIFSILVTAVFMLAARSMDSRDRADAKTQDNTVLAESLRSRLTSLEDRHTIAEEAMKTMQTDMRGLLTAITKVETMLSASHFNASGCAPSPAHNSLSRNDCMAEMERFIAMQRLLKTVGELGA